MLGPWPALQSQAMVTVNSKGQRDCDFFNTQLTYSFIFSFEHLLLSQCSGGMPPVDQKNPN